LLLIFCEQESSNDNVGTEHFLSTVRSAIESSDTLKQKIKEYFNNLPMTVINMKQISNVFCSIHKFQFLSRIDKNEVFRKALLVFTSSEYNINWFQYFLAKGEVWKNSDQNLRVAWFHHWACNTMDTYKNLTYVLKATDKLLDTFDDSANNDHFHTYFVYWLVRFCFNQGKL
jgi:hypothetical protein